MKGFKHPSLLTATLIFTSTTTYATYNGFYLGANAGMVQTQAEIESNSLLTGLFEPEPLDLNASALSDTPVFNNSALGAAHVGLGHHFKTNPLYLGAEMFISNSNPSAENNTTNTSFNALQINAENEASLDDTEYGLDLKVGFLLNPATMLYGRMGVALNEVKLTSDYTTRGLDGAIAAYSAEESENVTALRLGVGAERYLSRHFSVTADYIYTDYGNIDTEMAGEIFGTGSDFEELDKFEANARADLQTQAVLLGANYYFAGSDNAAYKMDYDTAREHFNSAILGIRAGALLSNAEIDSSASAGVVGDPLFSDAQDIAANSYANGNTASLFAGYGGLLGRSPFYLAVEFFFSEIGEAENEVTETTGTSFTFFPPTGPSGGSALFSTVNTNLESEYGIDLRPGILLSENILLYGRIGAAINEAKISSDTTYTTLLDGVTLITEEFHSENEDESITAIRLGLGVEYYLWKKFSLNADYIYTDYNDIETEIPEIVSNDVVFSTETAADITTQAFLLGVTYHHF